MATNKRYGMFDCLSWGEPDKTTIARGDVLDVQMLLALRDALRANEPAPLAAASWMADAIDQTIQHGGSLDQRLGLKRRGKPSVRRTAEITRRDTLIRDLASRTGEQLRNKQAVAIIAIVAGRTQPPCAQSAAIVKALLTIDNIPQSARQVMRILSVGIASNRHLAGSKNRGR
jgi:hypothetical protein